jgi:hypothetical protein
MAEIESIKFKKFNGKNNFEIQKVKMHGVVKTHLGKAKQPATITDEE